MAFEKVYQFTDEIKAKIVKLERRILEEPDIIARKRMRSQITAYFDSLIVYHSTVLKMGKFVSQRNHCEQVMLELEPIQTKYYLNPPKKSKDKTLNTTT